MPRPVRWPDQQHGGATRARGPRGIEVFRCRGHGHSRGAYDSLTAQQRVQVADAKAIRRSQIGVVFPTATARRLRRYAACLRREPELEDQRTAVDLRFLAVRRKGGYLAVRQRCLERRGSEKTNAYEIGLKTVLLNDTLVFNTAVFYSEIEDYQQQVRIVDEYTTNLNTEGAERRPSPTPPPPATCRW